MRILASIAIAVLVTVFSSTALRAHCQMPCGIYDDHMRIHMIEEDCNTIEKAMNEIKENTATAKADSEVSLVAQQAVRWIMVKEEHAGKIQELASDYFLTQRIKPDQPQYEQRLKLLHGIMIEAMKCKQTLDVEHVTKLREHLAEFQKIYFAN